MYWQHIPENFGNELFYGIAAKHMENVIKVNGTWFGCAQKIVFWEQPKV